MPAVTALSDDAAGVTAAAKSLGLPTIRAEAASIATAAAKARLTNMAYLAEVLSAECSSKQPTTSNSHAWWPATPDDWTCGAWSGQ